MAFSQVPDFSAVTAVLEHLKELDKELKEAEVPPEASFNLAEITAAITQLEAERRAAHEVLEVETIENSKLRQQIDNGRERASQEITADLAAARASNAEEIEQLRRDLHAVSELTETTVKRQEALLSQEEVLCSEREQVEDEHEEVIAALNDQITIKYGLQMQLDQTQQQIQELKSCITVVQQDKITLQQNMVLEREACNLSGEVDQAEEKIKQQKQAIRRSKKELVRLNEKKQETHDHLGKLVLDRDKLESDMQRVEASRCQCEKQLQGEIQKHQELRQQREALKKELHELGEAFRAGIQRHKEEIASVEDKIEKAQGSRLLCEDSLAQIYEVFKRHHDEEKEVRAEHVHVSQQLERSKLQLEESIATVVKHSKETREMDKQISDLLEAETTTKRVFERNQEELCGNVDTEKKNIRHVEKEMEQVTRLLEEVKRKQEEHVAKMTSDISNIRRRYQELREEEAALQKRQPKSVNADMLMSHIAQCEVAYKQEETKRHEEIEQCAAEAESITRGLKERQREVEEKEEMLREVEAKWNEEQSRHQRLKTLISTLSGKKSDLELSIQQLKEETGSMLQPREDMKAKLEVMRKSHIDVLDKQASELRAVEISIYDSSVKLEQVSMENSRLHLRIRQMTEDVHRARENRDKYQQEVLHISKQVEAVYESLQGAFREELSMVQDRQCSDGVLLESMSALMDHLKTRKQQLGDVSALLHQQMLNFSKRLGDKATEQKK